MSEIIKRGIAVGMALSAAGLIAIAGFEGYTNNAVQPVKDDKWTYGYGSTTKLDGTPVKKGDKITPPQALKLIGRDIAIKEKTLKKCFGPTVRLTQGEYDAYDSLAYHVGAYAVCDSSIVPKLKAGYYDLACKAIPSFNKVQNRNCCLPENKKFCGGVCDRRQIEYGMCMGVH